MLGIKICFKLKIKKLKLIYSLFKIKKNLRIEISFKKLFFKYFFVFKIYIFKNYFPFYFFKLLTKNKVF